MEDGLGFSKVVLLRMYICRKSCDVPQPDVRIGFPGKAPRLFKMNFCQRKRKNIQVESTHNHMACRHKVTMLDSIRQFQTCTDPLQSLAVFACTGETQA